MKEDAYLSNSVKITTGSSVKSIQEAFNALYPFLKIEFFKPDSAARSLKPELPADFLVKQPSLELSVPPATTVLQLEQLFKELLNLNVQVYRKAGSAWVETLLTGHWTLEQQNEEGKHFSAPEKGAVKKSHTAFRPQPPRL